MHAYPYKGERGSKIGPMIVRTKWMAPTNAAEYFFVHWPSQVQQSMTATKENVVNSIYF